MTNINNKIVLFSEYVEKGTTYYEISTTDSLDTLIQLHFSALSHRNNEVLRVLAIISCVFLPLTLITGFFGMNFDNMPELHWEYGYFIVLAIMGTACVLMYRAFKKSGWL